MKEVTWVLAGRLQDQETGNAVILTGTKITGTPLQVALIFESLNELGGPDVSVNTESDKKIYELGQETLKEVRANQNEGGGGDYEDPDKSYDEALALARTSSNWRIHTYPTEEE